MNSGIVVWPLDTHLAALTVAYSIINCASLFAALCWHGSIFTEGQISAEPQYAAIDWQCWVRYGSWSQCPHCGCLCCNDQYFRDFSFLRAMLSWPSFRPGDLRRAASCSCYLLEHCPVLVPRAAEPDLLPIEVVGLAVRLLPHLAAQEYDLDRTLLQH